MMRYNNRLAQRLSAPQQGFSRGISGTGMPHQSLPAPTVGAIGPQTAQVGAKGGNRMAPGSFKGGVKPTPGFNRQIR